MYTRIIKTPPEKSFFLFGPRGTGKTTWLHANFPKGVFLDMLESDMYNRLLASPGRLESFIPANFRDWVIIDEIQRVPALLHEVHRLIEKYHFKFILTGSSARKLKKKGVNLLAGRALTCNLYPLTALELKKDFDLRHSLQFGHLPATFSENDPAAYLTSYITTYLREEVQYEGFTRNLETFARFLEIASFSQGSVLNVSEIAREASIHTKVVENYFSILEDLMIAYRIPVFAKKAKRKLLRHLKFYFFDVGIYRTLRPKGPLDAVEETDGVALETLILQELKAANSYLKLGYELFYWRTANQIEVDFVMYGAKGFIAIEVKKRREITSRHLRGLQIFLKDYPQAKAYCLYAGDKVMYAGKIQLVPIKDFLEKIDMYLK